MEGIKLMRDVSYSDEPTHYSPKSDPGETNRGENGLSRALVAFMSASDDNDRGFAEVLVSFGAGINAAIEGDEWAMIDSFIDALKGSPDGFYVLECGWAVSGWGWDSSGSEFEVRHKRPLSPKERALISQEFGFDGVLEQWRAAYAETPCLECGKVGREHSPVFIRCPAVRGQHGTP